ncbi:MAG: hypothetical protein ABIW34_05820 [Ginsengibacter sp.]
MLLLVTKNYGKPYILLYQRDDGSETWMYADDFFVRHDLSHYCLEKFLGYKTAFMGMLNNGMDVKDFEDRAKRKQMKLSMGALYAENMANLFLMEIAQGNFESFNQVAKDSFESWNKEFPAPVLLEDEINMIRTLLRELLHSWNTLAPGKTMELQF